MTTNSGDGMTGLMDKLADFARGTAGLAAAGALAQAIPTVTSLGPVRAALWPGLTGLGDPGHVALTFDDGPDPASTPLFLDALDAAGVKATFFLLGEMVAKAPWLARQIADSGHEIGLHGWAHRAHIALSPAKTLRDLRQGRDEVASAIGAAPRWYRPPYGVATAATFAACRRLGLRPVLWSAWGRDWTAAAARSRCCAPWRGTCAAAAPCFCTTPTARPSRNPGGRHWGPCRCCWRTAPSGAGGSAG